MGRFLPVFVLSALFAGTVKGQTESSMPRLTVDRLFGSDEFRTDTGPQLQWSQRDSAYYTMTPASQGPGKDLVRVHLTTGEQEVILPAAAFIPKGQIEPLEVEAFHFSSDESQLLIFTSSQRVWRQKTRGDYWLLNLKTRDLRKLGGDTPPAMLMFAKFSPDGRFVAFVRENNIYCQHTDTLAITPLTHDGSRTLINGTGDWVNEEELDIRDGFRWSPDSKSIFFWQFDTSGVAKFTLVDSTKSNTPTLTTFPYPKVGTNNSATRIGVVSVSGGPVTWLPIPGNPREHYIPHAAWTPDGRKILIQQFNRLQTELRVLLTEPQAQTIREVMIERDAAWLENENPVRWLDGGKSLLWISERTGWRHVYRVDLDNGKATPVTVGEFDVIDIEAIDHANNWLYFAASPTNATQRYLFRVKLAGGPIELLSPTGQSGWHTYAFSPDAQWAVHTFSTFTKPPLVRLIHAETHAPVRTLADNARLRQRLAALEQPGFMFYQVDIGRGLVLDGWCITPPKKTASTKSPLLMHVYGEPHGQTVRDAWQGERGLWHWLLAQEGIAVASVDNRGTKSPRGREWRKAVHRKIGIVAPLEQAKAVEALLRRWPWVDPTRVGIWGWSGGGSMSLNAIFRYPDLYRTAIAIAPVPDQRLYDTIYQERYMGLPAENADGYRDGSPINHAYQLRGNLLLIHGTGDDNCHYQGTERLMEELISKGKQFQVMPYPNRSHSINEGAHTTRHLYFTMTRYLRENLSSPQAPEPVPIYETRIIQGWKVHIHTTLLITQTQAIEQALKRLEDRLKEVLRVIPAENAAKLQKVPLYFNPEYPGVKPKAEYHPSAGWLRDNGRDPAMARAVEFTNLRIFESEHNRMPYFILHELAHAYHHQFLTGGFANPEIQAAYTRAKDAGIYAKVERHFGNGRPNTFEKAYAMTSPMEYFAESTEAFFGRNDFSPFTRDELKTHDPAMHDLIERLWGVQQNSVNPANATSFLSAPPTLTDSLRQEPIAQLVRDVRQNGDAGRGAFLFFQPFLNCAKCHDGETGTQLGPDLSLAGKDAKAEDLIESVLMPSKVIKKGYESVIVTTADGQNIIGLLAEETNDTLTLIDPVGGKRTRIPVTEIERRITGEKSLMPEGLINTLSERQQFLDLAKYIIEIAQGGPQRAKELRPAHTTFVLPDYEKDIDHAGLIRTWDAATMKRGEAIYARICANCHGTLEHPGSLPTSPKFATHTFKNGSDPYSLYRTLTHGYNQMAPQTWMVPRQKYDVIHYLRETYLKTHNTKQYTTVDDAYLAKLPVGIKNAFGPAPASVEPWMAMDYGPSLMNTYEIGGPGPNIAYKGLAVRLDSGSGGVSRGRCWALFEHDTLRYAAGWTGQGFIDWKGIHFNGQHQVHPKLIGCVQIANPTGPGWADPETGSFHDPRPKGRDNRPYGPLPKSWASFKGTYAYGDQTVIAYTVGGASILELDSMEQDRSRNTTLFARTLEIGRSEKPLSARIAPENCAVAVVGDTRVALAVKDGFQVLSIPADATPTRVKVLMASERNNLDAYARTSAPPKPLKPLTTGGPKRWPEVLRTSVVMGKGEGPFSVDTFSIPERNPWNAQLRLTGFDFAHDGRQLAVCTWDGDVWMVDGVATPETGLSWRRIASGLFQPLGLKIRDGAIFVCCRDQIVKLHDLNGDGETDFYECFNNDHQVTEHFHEFAMGLQTDQEGNFYYAKSGRHGLSAIVPHHGTLLKVDKSGQSTEILATGFRAANGVCLNPDGTFFVTDQEGFWTPKNRINKVEKGGFYGNLYGYTDITDTSDAAMKQPLCWITNTFDRSPAEMVWIPQNIWGPLGGSLLNTSYGMGKIYVVPHETIQGQVQGGMCALPIPTFPTGVMRPRFHPSDGHLYLCGMYAWAGNQTLPGGFYRLRYTGKPVDLPIALKAKIGLIEITMSDPLDGNSLDTNAFAVKVWGLHRTKDYGSKHIDERILTVSRATLSSDRKTIKLELPDLKPTMCMEIAYTVRTADGRSVQNTIHNTIHYLGQ